MDLTYLLVLIVGAVAGGFVNGLAGFGTALFALGWWLQIMPPKQAVTLVLVMSIVSSIQGVAATRRAINWQRLAWFVLPGLAGIPIGLQLLDLIDPTTLKLVIAGFLILYGGYFVWRRTLPRIRSYWPPVDGALGFIGGVLGAMAGLSGALPTIWVSLLDRSKEENRSVLQTYNLIIQIVSAAMLLAQGTYTPQLGIAMLIVLPVSVAAAHLGLKLFARLADGQFRRLLVLLTLAAGLILIAREML